LARNGIKEGDVQFARAGGVRERWIALEKKEHAGTMLITPFDIMAKAKGFNVLAYAAPALGNYQGLVAAVTRRWAKDNEAQLVGFIRGYVQAVQWLYDPANKAAAIAILRANLTAMDERGHSASERNFHGRGSLQITGQPNYAECGQFLGLDLVGNQPLASQETVVWQTGLCYWMIHANPSVSGAQICHNAIAQGDFGQTIRIIKGDCASAGDRTTQYRKNCTLLGVDPGRTNCP